AIALEEQLKPPAVLVLRGERRALAHWSRELAREFLPDTLALGLENDLPGLPAVLDKPARAGPVNGWLCRGVSCLAPIGSLEELRHACKGAQLR
ncbi:MAG: thioredoxin domain-containing protein, partial [Pseudomonadota bacterium]